jgi:hypothetical protein
MTGMHEDEAAKYQDLKQKVGEKDWPAFLRLVVEGSAEPEFDARVEKEPQLRAAVEEAFRRDVETFAGFAQSLRAQKEAQPAGAARPPARRALGRWRLATAAASVALALGMGILAFDLARQNANLHGELTRWNKEVAFDSVRLAPLLRDPNPRVQEDTVRLIARLGPNAPPGAVPELIQLLNSEKVRLALRTEAALALGQMRAVASQARRPLQDVAFRDADDRLGHTSAYALGQIAAACDDKQLVPKLVAKLEKGDFPARVSQALLGMGPKAADAVPAIGRAIKSNKVKRDVGYEVLASIGEPSVHLLLANLKDEDGKVDQSAAQALIRVGPDAIPQLEKTLTVSRDPLLRREVERALIKIQSQAAVAD